MGNHTVRFNFHSITQRRNLHKESFFMPPETPLSVNIPLLW